MTPQAQLIFEQALALPIEAKANLVDLLVRCLDEDQATGEQEIDLAWAKEANDRFQAFVNGEIKAESKEEVMHSLRKRHAP